MTDELNTITTESLEQQPSFGLADLVFTLQIIEACTQRGAFRAEELSNVGAAYDRLRAFLIANKAINNGTAETAPGEDTATDTTVGE